MSAGSEIGLKQLPTVPSVMFPLDPCDPKEHTS
jgi:hypothetical protein